ncbi:MAG: tRNA preQ1(34) S-adenosylmethionine ribosyltransferase-isomerase QueA [Acholeplasmataceae bacterium]|nr:tRNA preQ1(34) S-adenosylmethionine ribosyltransferase-isomerase QueA [Acholeplasmataceae bacterium]
MKVDQFAFNLPENQIAQHPHEKRDHSKLMVLDRKEQTITHHQFYDIVDLLDPNSVLVINDTKVLPARLVGVKAETKASIEVLLLKTVGPDLWEAMVKPAKRVSLGTKIHFTDALSMECKEVLDSGLRVFKLSYKGLLIEVLEHLGTMPLPPYIKEKLVDQDRYQTVYAEHIGSAAAPTAGLHFTKPLLEKIKAKGIQIVPITLSVGLGTFKPVSVTHVEEHQMHAETYTISPLSARFLNEAVKNKRPIVCVGTTSLRALEANYNNQFESGTFSTNIFIYPGYSFKVCQQLITNFHLPKSTLIMLVSAFAGTTFTKKAYETAVEKDYRFFSFGDAMFIK